MRRTLAALTAAAALSIVAACGADNSPGGSSMGPSVGGPTVAADATTATTDADPACADIAQFVLETSTKTQKDFLQAAKAPDAELETYRQVFKQLYVEAASKATAAAGKALDPALKAALTTYAAAATANVTELSSDHRALTSIALMDRSAVDNAATQIARLCGQDS